MSRLVIASAAVLVAAGISSADPPEQIEYKSAEGRFIVLFPAR